MAKMDEVILGNFWGRICEWDGGVLLGFRV